LGVLKRQDASIKDRDLDRGRFYLEVVEVNERMSAVLLFEEAAEYICHHPGIRPVGLFEELWAEGERVQHEDIERFGQTPWARPVPERLGR